MVEGQIRDFGIGLEHFVFLAAKCVWAFGGGKKGQLGAGPNCSGSYLPLKVINEVKSLAVGLYHTSVITEAGTVLTWGCNDIGACGSSDQNRIHPSPVALDIKGIDFDSANLSVYNHGTVLSDCNQICVWGKVTEAEPIRRPHFLNDIRASNLELIQAAPNYLTLLVSKRNPLYRIAHVAVGSSKRMLFGLPNETQQVLCGQFIKLSVLSIYDTGDVLTVLAHTGLFQLNDLVPLLDRENVTVHQVHINVGACATDSQNGSRTAHAAAIGAHVQVCIHAACEHVAARNTLTGDQWA